MRSPIRVSWITGVAQAAKNGGVAIGNSGQGLANSSSTPVATKRL